LAKGQEEGKVRELSKDCAEEEGQQVKTKELFDKGC
jgi:hypothetical protein